MLQEDNSGGYLIQLAIHPMAAPNDHKTNPRRGRLGVRSVLYIEPDSNPTTMLKTMHSISWHGALRTIPRLYSTPRWCSQLPSSGTLNRAQQSAFAKRTIKQAQRSRLTADAAADALLRVGPLVFARFPERQAAAILQPLLTQPTSEHLQLALHLLAAGTARGVAWHAAPMAGVAAACYELAKSSCASLPPASWQTLRDAAAQSWYKSSTPTPSLCSSLIDAAIACSSETPEAPYQVLTLLDSAWRSHACVAHAAALARLRRWFLQQPVSEVSTGAAVGVTAVLARAHATHPRASAFTRPDMITTLLARTALVCTHMHAQQLLGLIHQAGWAGPLVSDSGPAFPRQIAAAIRDACRAEPDTLSMRCVPSTLAARSALQSAAEAVAAGAPALAPHFIERWAGLAVEQPKPRKPRGGPARE